MFNLVILFVLYAILLEVVHELLRFCKTTRISKVGPR